MKQLLKGIKNGFHLFGQDITLIVNSILLFFTYFIGIGLSFILTKLTNKKLLEKKRLKHSYWTDLNLKTKEIKEYYRQF
tara:strand:+ start:251 stop:487 length:237 start_codon:yes stop_codon:yes gene_type:complete